MTRDSIAITVAAFLFFAWLVAWALLATRRTPEPPQPPEPADEPEPVRGQAALIIRLDETPQQCEN